MRIQPQNYLMPVLATTPRPATQTPNPTESFQRTPFDREQNLAGYAQIARSMALGSAVGTVAGAAANLFPILPGLPTALATGLTASAGLITGAAVGLVVGYARLF